MYSYQYLLDDQSNIRSDVILRLPDYAYIPNNPSNKDWQAYQTWLADGNEPETAG